MAKYHAVKTRKADTPLATLRLWREDAEHAYWEADDPGFITNIPPDILRSYQPGTGLAFPELPDLAAERGDVHSVAEMFDMSDDATAHEVAARAHEETGEKGQRGKRMVKRQENMVENALRRDATMLQHLARPYTEWCVVAVRGNPLAVVHVPARGRGTTATDDGAAPTEAMHVAVQREAFRSHPIALMLWPKKFDEQLTRQEFAPRVLEFASQLARLYGRWLQAGKTFDAEHQSSIEDALREYAKVGTAVYKRVPLLDTMQADKELKESVKTALALHSADPLAAANAVIDHMGAAPVDSLELPNLD
jgi:hypothetical protein